MRFCACVCKYENNLTTLDSTVLSSIYFKIKIKKPIYLKIFSLCILHVASIYNTYCKTLTSFVLCPSFSLSLSLCHYWCNGHIIAVISSINHTATVSI